MTDWIVRRWARFGHERLYAETPGGTALGYLDVKTGRYDSDDISNLPLLQKALADHLASAAGGGVHVPQPELERGVQEVAKTAELTAKEIETPECVDLTQTVAGAAARERALEERAAQGRVRGTLARFFGAKTEERAWRIGADGEEAVAAQLAKLGPRWRVLHAVRVGEQGADIDHVVIGPAGVFTVNAKHHPDASIWVGGDTFMVNGRRVPYIRNSRHEAARAGRLLAEQVGFPVKVVGVIAVMGARGGYKIKREPEDGAVVVVERKRISQYLARMPASLSDRELDTIVEAARRSTTWRA